MRDLFSGRHGRVAAGLLLGEFITAMQALVVATVMPRVVSELHGLALYGLAFGAFLAANFAFLPFAGPWADRYGTRRVLGIALALLGAGLGLASLAHDMLQLVFARFVEGAGAGIDYAASFTAIVKTFPDNKRAKIFSLLSTAWVVPAIVAPSAGAVIATLFGWRWVFIAFLPLVAISAVLILPAVDDARSDEHLDPFGALRLLFSRATFLLRGRNAVFTAFALLHATFFGADAYLTLMLTAVRGLPLTAAGACVTLGALGWSVASLAQPSLLRTFRARALVMCGVLSALIAASGLIAVALGAPVAIAFVAWCAGGAGIGFAYPTLSLLGVADADEGSEGRISSAMLLAATFGMTLGVTVCGLPVSLAERTHAPLATSIVWTFGLSMCVALALVAVVPRLPNRAV